jgi:hypothetical protein
MRALDRKLRKASKVLQRSKVHYSITCTGCRYQGGADFCTDYCWNGQQLDDDGTPRRCYELRLQGTTGYYPALTIRSDPLA